MSQKKLQLSHIFPGRGYTCSVCVAVCLERWLSVHRDTWRSASQRRATAVHDSPRHNDPLAWSKCNYTGSRRSRGMMTSNPGTAVCLHLALFHFYVTNWGRFELGYLSTGDSSTLHLSDALHLLLHLLLLHQSIKVALLKLILSLRER